MPDHGSLLTILHMHACLSLPDRLDFVLEGLRSHDLLLVKITVQTSLIISRNHRRGDYRRLEDHFLDESWLSQTSLLSDKSCWMDHRRDLYVAE